MPLKVAFSANAMPPLQDAALAGIGIVLAWTAVLADEVRAGRLHRVLPEWGGPPVTLRALHASRVGLPPKVRTFLDFIVEATARLRGAVR